MIAIWMLASTALGALAGLAAVAAERALRLLGRQGRGAWMLALAVTCLWPVAAPVLRSRFAPPTTVRTTSRVGGGPANGLAAAVGDSPSMRSRLAAFDTPLLALWGLASAMLLLRVLVAVRALRRVARDAEQRMVDGRPVLVSPNVGPAAFGIVHPRIVLPRWSLDLDASMRELVLRHELEHVSAADPATLTIAWLLAALMPWNAALWWIARHLRTAAELDCDHRVVRRGADSRRYAQLLLLIAQRQGQAKFATMIAGSPSTLHERIAAMHATPPARPVLRAAALLLFALIVGGGAASPLLARELASVGDRVAAAPASKQDTTPKPMKEFKVDSPASVLPGSAQPRYPDILRQAGVSGVTIVQIVVDTTGLPMLGTMKVVRSAHELFTQAVKTALADTRFSAARVGERHVRQLVQFVYRFTIEGVAPADPAAPKSAVRTFDVTITAAKPR